MASFRQLSTKPMAIIAISSIVLAVLAAVIATAVVLSGSNGAEAGPIGRGRGYNKEEYTKARQRLLDKDLSRALGAGLALNDQETFIDTILLKEKTKIMEQARLDRLDYIPSQSFFKSKTWMENTTTFKIIRRMPKGAVLHAHEPAIASLDWLVKNVTYRDHVYMCTGGDGFIRLDMFLQPTNNTDCPWKSVKAERQAAASAVDFDKKLRRNLSYLSSDPLQAYPTTNKAWDRFNIYFEQVSILSRLPVLRDYFRQALQEIKEDNVQYIEVRGGMMGYSGLDGSTHDAADGVNMYREVTEQFVKENPDFFGASVIMSGLRFKPKEVIANEVKVAMELRREFPDFFLGYDLVAQEDPLKPLTYYIDALLYPTRNSLEEALPYFFHAAETNWQGTAVDENLVDALLLNTTRIGHGYGLAKHPELAEQVKVRGIAVEVNPISNQLLGLVSDLRNHAMTALLADDFPLVISSDDPATWEALPLTHDFFVAFMDMSGEGMGLAFLKQLAINSIKYSGLSASRKEAAMKLWQTKWDEFVTDTSQELSS